MRVVLATGPTPFPHLAPCPEQEAEVLAELASAGIEVRAQLAAQDEATQNEWLQEAEGLLGAPGGRVDAALLDRAPKLALVALASVGYDVVDAEECARRGVWVANAGGASVETTANMALALLLGASRQLGINHELVRRDGAKPSDTRDWKWGSAESNGHPLWGATDPEGKVLGVLGFGRIGQSLARKCHLAFGMGVIYTDALHIVQAAVPTAEAVTFDELLRRSDYLSIHTDLNERTRGLIGEDELGRMKDGAILINAARGGIVDEKALAAALLSGKLAGAGLDVFKDEPMVEPALLQVPNVILQPHTGSGTIAARRNNTQVQIQNVLNVLARGVAPLTPVNAPAAPRLTPPSIGPVGRARM